MPEQEAAIGKAAAEMVRVVITLEESVLLDDPGNLGADVGADDACGDLGMVERRQLVAHVVNERRDDEFVVRAVLSRARGALQ